MKKEVLFLASEIKDAEILRLQSKNDWKISHAVDGITASKLINVTIYDFILIDSKSRGYGAFRMLSKLQLKRPETIVFILTRENTETLEKFISISHTHVFTMPCVYSEMKNKIDSYLVDLETKNNGLQTQLVGSSYAVQSLRKFIKKAAMQEFPVMLYGESGCGKDLVANLIHTTSDCRESPFVPVNVNTIPPNLAESILFGTEKGAFTDATSRTGVFQQAEGGTVFLDEIESMDMTVQAKFLRVLETKQVKKLGSSKNEHCNFRLISASNRPLKKAIEKKLFREDLYYRLDVLRCVIPPLRKHKEDILPLSVKFLSKHNKLISQSAIEKLSIHSWPGNVRELQNCLARAICYSANEEKIKPKHIRF